MQQARAERPVTHAPEGLWSSATAPSALRDAAGRWAAAGRPLRLDIAGLRGFLAGVPAVSPLRASGWMMDLPRPDGTTASFRIGESPVMEQPLADAFPAIRTYAGQGVDDPTATVRFDVTPFGFHAAVISAHGSWYIDPVDPGTDTWYVSYFKRNALRHGPPMECLVNEQAESTHPGSAGNGKMIEGLVRTYRLAIACTGEYAAFYGGTKAGALAGIVTSINRVNGVYEREFGIHMNIVANDTVLIFTNAATDPYTNSSGFNMLGQNQSTCNSLIGSANYDIGHVFSTGGGGIASKGVVCNNSMKAQGVTGSPAPIGDPFNIDYVAHEMGHQFDGSHTFNSTVGNCGGGNRESTAAYEPGSGSTIMAYAGICGSQNLQNHSDDYFHTHSFDEIIDYITLNTGSVCPVVTTPVNLAPQLIVPSNYTIPLGTPFRLTATAPDPDGDPVTFCWEQHDLGPAGNWNAPSGNAPIFRSFNPVTTGTRLFPKLSNILNNSTTIGEIKPSYGRTLTFRCTARDNVLAGAGVIYNDIPVIITVATSGPFEVTSQNNAGVVWQAGTTETVTWSVNGTDQSPVNASSVNVLLSLDGGQTFNDTLGTGVPNNGAHSFTVPNASTNTARVMVEGAGNVFFDINNANFTINPLGIKHTGLEDQVNIYPNPAADELYLAIVNEDSGEVLIEVTDQAGRVIRRLNRQKQGLALVVPLGMAGDASGVYSVHLITRVGQAVKQVVKY